jgi:hypothetical protein
MPNDIKNAEVMQIIESALDLAGGSKQVIIDYLRRKYDMNTDSILQYKTEFENYLRETLGNSADIIISRIDKLGSSDKKVQKVSNSANFVICDNCFWCASCLSGIYESKCLSCGRPIISATPIVRNETFMVEVDKKRGITLSFH